MLYYSLNVDGTAVCGIMIEFRNTLLSPGLIPGTSTEQSIVNDSDSVLDFKWIMIFSKYMEIFEVMELFSTTDSSSSVCLWNFLMCVFSESESENFFVYLLAISEAKTARLKIYQGCPHTFNHIMFACGAVTESTWLKTQKCFKSDNPTLTLSLYHFKTNKLEPKQYSIIYHNS